MPDSMLPNRAAAYKIFTQTFQINSLFALDSIKYLHVVLNIHNICIAQVRSFVLNVPQIMRKVSCQRRVEGEHLGGQKQDRSG